MHPLNEILFGSYAKSESDIKIQSWAEERSEWYLSKYPNCSQEFRNDVHDAFQLQPPTLREKFADKLQWCKENKYDIDYHLIPEILTQLAEEHYKK